MLTIKEKAINNTTKQSTKKIKEDASYLTIHRWIMKNKPKPKLCKRCKERPAEELSYNNIDRKEYSKNPDDYEWLCKSCHRLKDSGNGAILTKARIHRIREFYACGAATQQELAGLFKVNQMTISIIVNYEGFHQRPVNPEVFKELIKDLEAL